MKWLAVVIAIICVVSADIPFGTYLRPFNAQSLWNSIAVNPVFVPNVTVPTSSYFPSIANGEWSTGVFLANSSMPPQTIFGPNGTQINNVDNLSGIPNITLPHWPSDSIPASGGDGHCDIADETTGMLHSFWQLRHNNVTGVWTAVQYAWSPLNGYGFGTPDHYYQGARAAGVPTSAGIIRMHEVNDSFPLYRHALAMSMTFNALSPKPSYIYPATSSDWGAADSDYGTIPEGALMLLPSDFNTSFVTSPVLLKVVETLKVYGAYVVDRNTGTPFAIYVENGFDFRMSNATGWDPVIANELQVIRAALRMVASADHFLDGNGDVLQPYTNVNLLSMRGSSSAWARSWGDATATFDTWTQSLIFYGNNSEDSYFQNWSGLGFNQVTWAAFKPKTNYTFFVQSTPGVSVGITIAYNQTKQGTIFSCMFGNGQSASFIWPEPQPYMVVYASKDAGPQGSGRGFIMETDNMVPTAAPTKPVHNLFGQGKIKIQ